MKEAILTRKYSPDKTIGQLKFVSDIHIITIDTLERPWLDNKHEVSCIPEGIYKCFWSHMTSHNVDHYELENVKDRTAIFIHRGLKVTDSLGCILSSPNGINLLESSMKKEHFVLTIKS